ncbi:MAG: hypothetical protein AABZ64_11560 [Nitrospinota bacterium]
MAYIAGLCGFGLIPRATLEIPSGERRLERIFRLIRSCSYSLHDLSRVQVDRIPPPTPRFNMPFELGLVVACAKLESQAHKWFVFEARKHRLSKSLSDLDGTDPHIHNGKPRDLLTALTNVFVRSKNQPTARELGLIFTDLKKTSEIIKENLNSNSLFGARAFHDLVIAARTIAREKLPWLTY